MSEGFVMIPTHVMRDRTLTGTARLLYGIILSYAWGSNPCTASNQTLCDDAGCGRTAMYESLKSLKAAKLITIKREGDMRLIRPVMRGGVRIPDDDPPSGIRESGIRTQDTEVKEVEEKQERKASPEERAREKSQSLPDGFPEDLVPHARRAFKILRDVAEQHNAKPVTPRGVGLAIMSHPGRRPVQTAYELAGWAESSRPIKDAVSTYRTFLGKADVHAGIERFDQQPVAAENPNGNVHAIRPRRSGTPWSAADIIAITRENA